MDEKDKILLSAYLDNDLSEDEASYVENLLEAPEAQDYLNSLKKTNIQVGTYYKESLKSDVAKEAFKEVNKLNREGGALKGFIDFVFGKLFLTNLATATFAVFSFLTIPNILNFADSGNSGLDDLLSSYDSKSFVEFNIIKTRGLSEENLNKEIEQLMFEMVEKKNLNASISYGDENYIVSLIEVVYSNEEGVNCFKGTIYSSEKEDILFCVSNEKTSLLFID